MSSSSVTTPAEAPADGENWFVLANAPSGVDADWEAEADRVVARLGVGQARWVVGLEDVDPPVLAPGRRARHVQPPPAVGQPDQGGTLQRLRTEPVLPQGGDGRRIALLALDQAAWALAGLLGIGVADSRTEIDWAAANRLAVAWAPARMVADQADLPADPQALALWLAERVQAPRLLWALPEGVPLPAAPAGTRAAQLRAPG